MPRRADTNKERGRHSKKHNRRARLLKENGITTSIPFGQALDELNKNKLAKKSSPKK